MNVRVSTSPSEANLSPAFLSTGKTLAPRPSTRRRKRREVTVHADIQALYPAAEQGRSDLSESDVGIITCPCPVCLAALYVATPSAAIYAAPRVPVNVPCPGIRAPLDPEAPVRCCAENDYPPPARCPGTPPNFSCFMMRVGG